MIMIENLRLETTDKYQREKLSDEENKKLNEIFNDYDDDDNAYSSLTGNIPDYKDKNLVVKSNCFTLDFL